MDNTDFFSKFKTEPCIRVAIVSDPEIGELGTGLQKDITFYGDYDTLSDEYRVMSETMAFLAKSGMGSWAIKKVYSPHPLDENAEIPGEPDKRIQYKCKVTVSDTTL